MREYYLHLDVLILHFGHFLVSKTVSKNFKTINSEQLELKTYIMAI